ncbi:hypothetical protein [Alienimonas chondri]|uniref:Uncharacterized protein n=1 Tax=Alienimonas chondri TaxID=2681879 RepID=A0ABX1VIX4_9PLAN|nr:hypothetical protein [Alienimonas chondri]NNJ28078.1 hypothetical protein [Alienimonas chondri]
MSRQAFDDDWDAHSRGFEDPRFSGGRHPDDDDDRGFGRMGDGATLSGRSGGGGRRGGCGCFLSLALLGAVMAVVCCGGFLWFGLNGHADRVVNALDDDPAVRGQLEEALGPDYRLTPDLAASTRGPGGADVFDAAGSLGSGRLFVVSRRGRGPDQDDGPPALVIVTALLEMNDGRRIELEIPEPRDERLELDPLEFDFPGENLPIEDSPDDGEAGENPAGEDETLFLESDVQFFAEDPLNVPMRSARPDDGEPGATSGEAPAGG